MASVSAEVVKRLLTLAKADDKRKLDWPNDWRPHEVYNPDDGAPFTNESAWDLIIRLLEEGETCKSVAQKTPPGTVAFVLRPRLSDGWKLYIKIRFNKNQSAVFGRSFHYDERQIADE